MQSIPGSRFKFVFVLFYLLFTSTQILAQQASVRSELSSDTITRDESVTLTVTAIGLDGELDASSLAKDFEVVGRSSSRQVSTVTGANNQLVTTSVVTWALELLPKDVGVFTVPAVSVRGQKSELLTLTVNELPKGAKRDVFVEASVDTQSPWVQSQVTMTLKVYQAIDIVDGGLDVPSGDNLLVERIGEDSRQAEVIDGRQYSVTERRFALFPQKSGSTIIEPITLSVSIPADPDRVRGFFSPTRKLTRRTSPITLNVQARPPNGSAWWLPARAVQLERTWSGDPDVAEVDQPLTRSIVLRASGVLDSQLPEINIPAIEGLSLYAEQPARAMGANESGLVAEQRINWAVIPQRVGELVLPAINVEWFNTQTGQKEVAVLPEEIIRVKASTSTTANQGDSTATPRSDGDTFADSSLDSDVSDELPQAEVTTDALADQARLSAEQDPSSESLNLATQVVADRIAALENSSSIWRNTSLAAIGLWLLTAAVWLYRRYRNPGSMDVRSKSDDSKQTAGVGGKTRLLYSKLSPLAAVEASCKEGDLAAVQRSLLEWSATQWADHMPLTLNSLAKKLPAGEAQMIIRQLDEVLYSQRTNVAAKEAIVTSLKELPLQLRQAITGVDDKFSEDRKTLDSLPHL